MSVCNRNNDNTIYNNKHDNNNSELTETKDNHEKQRECLSNSNSSWVHSNVRYFRTTRTVKTKYDHAKQCQIPKNHSKNNNKDDLCINVCIPKLKCSSLFVLLVRLHNTSIPCVPQRCNQPHLMEAPISPFDGSPEFPTSCHVLNTNMKRCVLFIYYCMLSAKRQQVEHENNQNHNGNWKSKCATKTYENKNELQNLRFHVSKFCNPGRLGTLNLISLTKGFAVQELDMEWQHIAIFVQQTTDAQSRAL